MAVAVVTGIASAGGGTDRIGDTATARTDPGAIRTIGIAIDATRVTINLPIITVRTILVRITAIETIAVR